MDMARKFLQMGYTRSRRYANHKGGRKYKEGTKEILPLDPDPVKARSAEVFREAWLRAKEDPEYQRLMAEHREAHESATRRDDATGSDVAGVFDARLRRDDGVCMSRGRREVSSSVRARSVAKRSSQV